MACAADWPRTGTADYDTRLHYYLRVTHDEKHGKVLGIMLTDDGVLDERADSQIAINDWQRIFPRAAGDGPRLQCSALADTRIGHEIGPNLDCSKLSDDCGSTLRSTGAMAGWCAQDLGGTHAVADFDDFSYQSV